MLIDSENPKRAINIPINPIPLQELKMGNFKSLVKDKMMLVNIIPNEKIDSVIPYVVLEK
ncbi:hypothetical protein OfM1_09100 [Lactovum odontotermitis]